MRKSQSLNSTQDLRKHSIKQAHGECTLPMVLVQNNTNVEFRDCDLRTIKSYKRKNKIEDMNLLKET